MDRAHIPHLPHHSLNSASQLVLEEHQALSSRSRDRRCLAQSRPYENLNLPADHRISGLRQRKLLHDMEVLRLENLGRVSGEQRILATQARGLDTRLELA
jgi:hypothetical protein